MDNAVELIHRPLGDRHPYEPGADERVPRTPAAAEPVDIRFLTRPIGAVHQAQVSFWAADQPEAVHYHPCTFLESVKTEGAFTEDGHLSEAAARAGLVVGVDRWQASLPGFPAGTIIHYQLTAESDAGRRISPIFTYTVRQTISLDQVVTVYQSSTTLLINLHHSETGHTGYLQLSAAAEGQLQLTVGQGDRSEGDMAQFTPSLSAGDPTSINLGPISVIMELDPFNLKIFYHNQLLIASLNAPQLIMGDHGALEAINLTFATDEDEAFYGFGERFNALNQRGQQLDVRVYEQYKNHGRRTYMPVPLLISSKGYGLLVQSLRRSLFDLAKTDPNHWTVQTELGSETRLLCDILLSPDADLLDLIGRFTTLTGRPVLPPPWAFGLWMSGNEWNTQARVAEIMEQNEAHQIPATVLVLEAWSDEHTFYIWNDAQYQPRPGGDRFTYDNFTFPTDGMWPDPKKMIEQLHQQGIRVLLWQIPVLKENESGHVQLDLDKSHMVENGFCVHHEDGTPYQIRPFWFRDGLLIDFTHPEGREWWMEKRRYLLDEMKIDGFKTDGGEHIWGRDLVFADSRRSDEIWNEYPNLYAGAYFNFARQIKPDAITFSRAGTTGAQAFPCHWAGDENSTWAAFRHSILAGLNAAISGIPFWGWDFAGFSGEIPTAELYLRAAAMATFCPIMQYHSEYNHHRQPSNDRTPWNIQHRTGDPMIVPIFRTFANLRMNLLPYITSQAWHTSQSGVPMLRSLSLVYPADLRCRQYQYQYLFGDTLLIAPVVEEGVGLWPVYLPAGEWVDFWTDLSYQGEQVIQYPTPPHRIPVFVRRGAILPLNVDDTFALGSPVGNAVDQYHNLCFKIYPKPQGEIRWYDSVQQEMFEISYRQEIADDHLSVFATQGIRPFSLLLPAGQFTTVTLNGTRLAHQANHEESGWDLFRLPAG